MSRSATRSTWTRFILACMPILAFPSCSSEASATSNRYALVIGVGTYASGYGCLYADNDASNMADLLGASGWTVSKKLISGALCGDETPTYENIKSSIAAMNDAIGGDENASVLIYFSGHGLETSSSASSSMGTIVPYDASEAATERYQDRWGNTYAQTSYSVVEAKLIPADLMTRWIGGLACKNKILILDSCYSGHFVSAGAAVDASPQSALTEEGTTEEGLVATAVANLGDLIAASLMEGDPRVLTISAAGSEESSFSGPVSMADGVFTYYLLKSATGGDANGDDYVTATEAFAYTKSLINSSWNSGQYKRYGGSPFLPHISGGAGDLVLFVNK